MLCVNGFLIEVAYTIMYIYVTCACYNVAYCCWFGMRCNTQTVIHPLNIIILPKICFRTGGKFRISWDIWSIFFWVTPLLFSALQLLCISRQHMYMYMYTRSSQVLQCTALHFPFPYNLYTSEILYNIYAYTCTQFPFCPRYCGSSLLRHNAVVLHLHKSLT